jgi:signal transduction histidine kinase
VRCEVADDVQVAPEVAEQLVRIVREAVTNATRHGGADLVELRVVGGRELVLTVADNGSGFDAETPPNGRSGFGLISMQERAEALGGVFVLRSAPGAGTTVEVRIPSTT